MSISFQEYLKRVQVFAIPTTVVQHPNGGLDEDTMFWIHTVGMGQFDRPEIEMVEVPALWVRDAMSRINHWAHYSIDNEIKSGENVREGDHDFNPILTLVESPDENEFWADQEKGCLRIVFGAMMFECQGCQNKVH